MTSWTSPLGRLAAAAYDFGVEHEWLARPAGRLLWGTDTALFYAGIRRLGDLPDGTSVLDVPCGGGLALRGLRPDRLRYVGADISASMLERARRRSARLGREGVGFVAADVGRLPFGDGAFDLCLCFNGLHCLPDPARAVREMARCLRPGGRLVGDLVVRRAGARQDAVVALLRRAGLFGDGGTAEDAARWLSAAGLRVERFERSGALVHFAAVRVTGS